MSAVDHFSDLSCSICYSAFSEKKNIPRILKCGHTHCEPCIVQLIVDCNGKCGECRADIAVVSLSQLPVNYAILRLTASKNEANNKFIDSKSIEDKIDLMVKTIGESVESNSSKLKHLFLEKQELEMEMNLLLKTKKEIHSQFNELSISTSLEKTVKVAKDISEKIAKVDTKTAALSLRLKKCNDVKGMQSIFDSPEDFVLVHEKVSHPVFVRGKKIYMQNPFEKPKITTPVCEVQYNLLEQFLCGTFMIVERDGGAFRLEFEPLKPNSKAWHNFFLRCCRSAPGFTNVCFRLHEREHREGESVVLSQRAQILSQNRSSTEAAKLRVKKGFVESFDKDTKGTQIRLFLEGWPACDARFCFAKVTRGLDYLTGSLRNLNSEVRVKETGLVFDMSV